MTYTILVNLTFKVVQDPCQKITLLLLKSKSVRVIVPESCFSVGIVIPSTWFVYLYKQTVSITVVVIGTKQFNDKTTHRQQLKTGFVQKWENRSPELFQDYSRTFSFFKDSISSQFCITQRFKVHFFFQLEAAK